MTTTKPIFTLPENPLDRIRMTALDRLRAEAAIRRGEYIAELILEATNAVRSLFGGVKIQSQTTAAHRLGPTG